MGQLSLVQKPIDEVHTRDRGTYLQFFAANICNVSAKLIRAEAPKLPPDPHFSVIARAFNAERFTILRSKTQGDNIQRDRTVSDIQGDELRRYAVNFHIGGAADVKQLGREVHCPTGSMVMTSGSEPLSFKKVSDHDGLTVLLPSSFVEERLTKVEDICARRLEGPSGLQRLVFTSMASLQEEASDMSPHDFQKSISILSELIVLTLGQLSDVKSGASPVRSANLTRVKRIIRTRCEDPDLSLTNIALECGMSLRYLHNLFRDDGQTISEYIMFERLRRARRMLEIGSPLTTRVTDVCFASGFSNVSHFSTAFKRTFSVSPVDVLRNR